MSAVEFAEWMDAAVLAKPAFAKAFAQCREVIGCLYQDWVLSRLQAAEAAATLRAIKFRLGAVKDGLGRRRATVATVACIKQLVASLALANAPSGFYADQLGVLNGRLLNTASSLEMLLRLRSRT